MDPYSGDVFELRRELAGATGTGIDMEELRAQVAALGEEATEDEVRAMRARALVSVSEEAARKLKLGERERERRRRRRKAERRARRQSR